MAMKLLMLLEYTSELARSFTATSTQMFEVEIANAALKIAFQALKEAEIITPDLQNILFPTEIPFLDAIENIVKSDDFATKSRECTKVFSEDPLNLLERFSESVNFNNAMTILFGQEIKDFKQTLETRRKIAHLIISESIKTEEGLREVLIEENIELTTENKNLLKLDEKALEEESLLKNSDIDLKLQEFAKEKLRDFVSKTIIRPYQGHRLSAAEADRSA